MKNYLLVFLTTCLLLVGHNAFAGDTVTDEKAKEDKVEAAKKKLDDATAAKDAAEKDYKAAVKNGTSNAPQITEITPAEPAVGSSIIIKGSNFGSNPGTVELSSPKKGDKNQKIELEIEKWTENEITAKVPKVSSDETQKLVINVAPEGSPNQTHLIKIGPLRTDRKFQVEFLLGDEFALESMSGKKNFSGGDAFAELRVTVRPQLHYDDTIKTRWCESGPAACLWSFVNVKLTTVNLQQGQTQTGSASGSSTDIKKEKSYATNFGLAYRLFTASDIEMSIIGKLGGQTSKSGPDFLLKDSIGLRFLQTGEAVNGAYFDIGHGQSDNFSGSKHRYKIEMFLPLDVLGFDTFLGSNIETDFGKNPDSVSIVIGARVKPEQILDFIKK